MKFIRKKTLWFGVVILVLAAAGAYFLLKRNSSDSSARATQEQTVSLQKEEQNAPGSITSSVAGPQQFAGMELSNAIAQLEDWLRSASGNDGPLNRDFIRVMMKSLQNKAGDKRAFYVQLRHLLEDPSIDIARKQDFITALDRAANPIAVQMLVELAQQNLSPALKQMVVDALNNVGEYYWDSASLAEAMPIVKALWLQSQDPAFLSATAKALGRADDPAYLNLLMESVLSGSRSVAEIEHSSDSRVSAAWAALNNIHDPKAIPVLQNNLQSSTNILEISIAANLLAGMGNVEATKALVTWAQGVDDGYTSVVREAFSRVGTYDSLQYLKSFLAQDPPFKSKQVQSAITSVVRKTP